MASWEDYYKNPPGGYSKAARDYWQDFETYLKRGSDSSLSSFEGEGPGSRPGRGAGRDEQIRQDVEITRRAQVQANAATSGASEHTWNNTVVGSRRLSQAVRFDKVFLTEPSFTTGGSVIKSPPARTAGSDFRDPIISAGVTSWLRDGLTYVGANVYLVVYYPGQGTQGPIVVPDPPYSSGPPNYPSDQGGAQVSAPWLRAQQQAQQQVQREAQRQQEVARSAAAVATGGGEYLHWMRFYATGYANMGKAVTTTLVKELPSRLPGVGEMTTYLGDTDPHLHQGG